MKLISRRHKEASKDKPKAGVFITLPDDLAKQFPLLGKHDDSPPHVTALFIGEVLKKDESLLLKTIKEVAELHEPFVMKLDEKVTYFPASKHSDDCKIAKLKIISPELHEFHKALKEAIGKVEMHIDDHFSGYKPHVTLSYMPPPRKTYDRDVPSGSWVTEEIHIWNGDKKNVVRLGNKKKASLSCRHKNAGIEQTQSGIGISTSARKYYREIHPEMAGIMNAELNQSIARYDVIVIQPSYKEPSDEIRKMRLQPGWGVE